MSDGIAHIFGGMGSRPTEYSRGGDRTDYNRARDTDLTSSGSAGKLALEKLLQDNNLQGSVKLMRGSDAIGTPMAYFSVVAPASTEGLIQAAFPGGKLGGIDIYVEPPVSEAASSSLNAPLPEEPRPFKRIRDWFRSSFE
ncbi:MAG: hypothetical protein ACT4TC_13265 [Myxococcaceae bacterium]